MFGWRKRNEGFEWREYVRTTILVRREKRRQQIEEIREAAVNKVKEAGERGVRAGAAGADKVGRAAKAGIADAGRSLGDKARDGGAAALAAGRHLGRFAGRMARTLNDRLAEHHDGVRKIVLAVAGVATFWACARYWGHGIDRETTAAAFIAAAAAALAGLMSLLTAPRGSELAGTRDRMGAMMGAVRLPVGRGMALSAVLIAVLAGGWMWMPSSGGIGWGKATATGPGQPARATGRTADSGRGDTTVSGRAVALTGDALRVAGQRIRLAAIEAPEQNQKCSADGGRTWACGTAATQALAARVSSRPVRCEVTKSQNGMTGSCTVDGNDLAAALVRGGHVFAEGGWFARYAAEEAEAREAKAGIWRGGATERPDDYRSKVWDEARRHAPDGCPIKGQKPSSDKRVYVLPWSAQYDRVKVRAARGERWFCSEAEAQAAGWSPIEKS